jgi:hypothetical protein
MGGEMMKVSGVEQALIQGDLAGLTADQRVNYYKAVCESVGLNPLTKPFDYLELDGGSGKKLVLYAKRDATDQLRKIHGVSVTITADGREDESTGAVPIEKEGGEWKSASSGKRYFAGNGTFTQLRGDALANALMKAETKAKRRVTLSICGLGILDETEVETIPGAHAATHAEQPAPRQLPPRQVEAEVTREPGEEPATLADLCSELIDKLSERRGISFEDFFSNTLKHLKFAAYKTPFEMPDGELDAMLHTLRGWEQFQHGRNGVAATA